MPTLEFSPERMYTFIKGYATALGWTDVLNAMAFARRMHADQNRKDGLPYIAHPLTMACHALALGINSEPVVAACMLHDVCEDCGVKANQLPVSDEIQDAVNRLTHVKTTPLEIYYDSIAQNWISIMVKILDRCHNVSSMAGTFSQAKCQDYILESETHVMPLFRILKERKPEYGNVLFVLKYHVMSVDNSLKALLGSVDGPA